MAAEIGAVGVRPDTGSDDKRPAVLHWMHPMLIPALVVATAAVVTVLALPQMRDLDLSLELWLIAFVVGAEVAGVPLFERSSYSISAVPTVAAAVLLGVPGALGVAVVGAVTRGVRRRTKPHKVLFNASVYVVASAAAAVVFAVSGVRIAPSNLPAVVGVGALVGLAYYAHTFAVAAAIAGELASNAAQIWNERFRWLIPHYAVLGSLSMLFVLAYATFGVVGAAAFVVPPLMMRSVAKYHLDRSLETIDRLSAMNAQLQAEVDRRTAAEAESADRYQQAAEALRQRDQFLSVAAHELKTPVTSLWGFVQWLQRLEGRPDGVDRDRLRQVLRRLDAQASKMGRLVDQLLDVSRLQADLLRVERRPVDLVDVASDAVQSAQVRTSSHDVSLHAGGPVVASVDALRIEHVLGNLLENAIKYSPDGGGIEVTVEATPDGTARLVVRDHGIGVAPENRARIFEQYYRAHDDGHRSGLGLGLYITRRIVEMHDGHIELEAPPDGGSRFVVTLPIERDARLAGSS